jgi:hypothetical protein
MQSFYKSLNLFQLIFKISHDLHRFFAIREPNTACLKHGTDANRAGGGFLQRMAEPWFRSDADGGNDELGLWQAAWFAPSFFLGSTRFTGIKHVSGHDAGKLVRRHKRRRFLLCPAIQRVSRKNRVRRGATSSPNAVHRADAPLVLLYYRPCKSIRSDKLANTTSIPKQRLKCIMRPGEIPVNWFLTSKNRHIPLCIIL